MTSPGLARGARAAATSPAWVRLVVMLGMAPASPAMTATVRITARTRRSRKVESPKATNRTQAGEVAAALAPRAKPGDVIAYCPDQLGPAVNRLLPAGRYQQITFPRGTGPTYVNWVDYAAASHKGSPVRFGQQLERMAGPDHQIFVVWYGSYQTFGTKCEQILQT